jgi:cation/acetate symporter
VLVSPNMTYPLLVKEGAQKVIAAAPAKLEALNAKLAAATEAKQQEQIKLDIAGAEKALKKAEGDLQKFEGQTTSIVGLEKPLIGLKNPGIFSIPLGFLCVILGSLLYRDRRALDMWDELYVRQNTGIGREGAVAH